MPEILDLVKALEKRVKDLEIALQVETMYIEYLRAFISAEYSSRLNAKIPYDLEVWAAINQSKSLEDAQERVDKILKARGVNTSKIIQLI